MVNCFINLAFFRFQQLFLKLYWARVKALGRDLDDGSCTSRSGPPPSIMPLTTTKSYPGPRRKFSEAISGMILLRKRLFMLYVWTCSCCSKTGCTKGILRSEMDSQLVKCMCN